jgi:glycosyltransferase involved in cell wall biosynthesis
MISKIGFHSSELTEKPVFSILIPSWNNLDYLKCCVESIRKNSRYQHQIIVHVNEGKDGSLEWVKNQSLSYSYSEENVGVCYGFNSPATLAVSEYIVLSDDDYYFAPDWDYHLLEEIKKLDHIYFCICGTMIEHSPTLYTSMIAPHNFGKTVKEFDEERFLKEYSSFPFDDWNGANWYPMVHVGVRYFKGVSLSRVYHFVSRSTARVKKNDGNKQFLLKWGISKSTFFDMYLSLGQKFMGYTPDPDQKAFRTKILRDKAKRLFSVWK